MLRSAVAYGTFPALVGGATLVGAYAFEHLRPDVVVGLVGFACVLIVAVLERVHPYKAAYNRSRGDVGTDLLHNAVSGLAIPEATKVVCFGFVYAAGAAVANRFGFTTWPTTWPLLAQLALALLVAELPSYWFHRLQHTSEFWWRMHATHHSVPRLYWLNAARFHPLDGLFSYAILMFPLVVLGAPETTLALFTIFVTAHGLLQHANIALSHGPLNWVFSTAELHRWHHAPNPLDGNHNFGTVLLLWDVLFGTRHLPASRQPPEDIGIAGMHDFPTDYLGQLASPLTWSRIGGRAPRHAAAELDAKGQP